MECFEYISYISFAVEDYFSLFPILFVIAVMNSKVKPMPDEKSIVNALVGWSQTLHSSHAHSERNHITLFRATVHHLESLQNLCIYFGGIWSSQSLSPNNRQGHLLHWHFDLVKSDCPFHPFLDMILVFVQLKLYMQPFIDSHLQYCGFIL